MGVEIVRAIEFWNLGVAVGALLESKRAVGDVQDEMTRWTGKQQWDTRRVVCVRV